MARWLRHNTAQTELIGPFLDKTDGVTEEVGLAGEITELSKDGGALTIGPALGTHDAEGWYPVLLATSHTNILGSFIIKAHDPTTHLPVWHEWMVLPANVYDSLVLGTDKLDVNTQEMNGSDIGSGNNAIVKLKQLDIQNSGGSALIAKSSSSNVAHHGMEIAQSSGGGGDAMNLNSAGSHGINARGEAAGIRAKGDGGDGGGPGMLLEGDTNADGLKSVGAGTGSGAVFNSGTGAAAKAVVMESKAASGNGTALDLIAVFSGNALSAVNGGSGDAVKFEQTGTGRAFNVNADNNTGMRVRSASGTATHHAFEMVNNGSGEAAHMEAGGANPAFGVKNSGTGDGVNFTAGTGKSGLVTTGNGAGHGASFVKGASGKDIDADEIDTIATINNKMGSITGSGDNTVLGYFKANLSKSAATPSDIGGTFSVAADSNEAIRDRGDAAWSSAAMNPQVLQETTIATLASQTSFTLTAGSADDNVYNGALAVITDASTSTQKAIALISDYTGATKTVTLAVDPAIFTMAVTDNIDIIASPKQLPNDVFATASGLGSANDARDATLNAAAASFQASGSIGEVFMETHSATARKWREFFDTGVTPNRMRYELFDYANGSHKKGDLLDDASAQILTEQTNIIAERGAPS